jgi:hypothetical protein
VEGIELGFGGSSEGLELGLSQIAECDDVDAADRPKPLKGRSIVHLMDQQYFHLLILNLVVNMWV